MSKISFQRHSKDRYIQKFNEKTGALDWPPQPGAEIYVENRLIDLITHEAMSIIKPQAETFKVTIPSHRIMQIVMDNVKVDAARSPADHYKDLSDNIFSQIEQEMPGLIGQDDPSSWAFINDV